MHTKMDIGILGGAGYTGGELLRLLLNHPMANIAFVQSTSQQGKAISDIHTDLVGDTHMRFVSEPADVDILFLCTAHGESSKFLSSYKPAANTKIIDLSQDHRVGETGFVYGLPELNNKQLSSASKVANPGCFATAIQLALMPLAHAHLLQNDIHISGTTGSTGAGQALSHSSHFSWRNSNMGVYKAFEHQHLAETIQSLKQLQPEFDAPIHFIPHRGSFTRGILVSVYTTCPLNSQMAVDLYSNYYTTSPFVHISKAPVDLKQVVNTNKCLLHIEKHGTNLLITSVIDNLLKGASGQAVQNMNLLFGWPEKTGLHLKASAF
jgi:N-acetyl-gamma-glutamyl-phosphate reductase